MANAPALGQTKPIRRADRLAPYRDSIGSHDVCRSIGQDTGKREAKFSVAISDAFVAENPTAGIVGAESGYGRGEEYGGGDGGDVELHGELR